MSPALSALCYLQAWEQRSGIPGGIAFEPLLRRLALDHSPASLARVDVFLDALRTAKKPQREAFLADAPGQNLLYLLAFYVADVVGRTLHCAPEWIAHQHSGLARLEGALGQRSFETSIVCNFPGAGARLADFAPLVAISGRLFGGTDKSVAFSAGALIPPALQASALPLPAAPGFGYPFELQEAISRCGARDRAALEIQPPAWAQNDPLASFFAAVPHVLRHGRVAWGAVIQANQALLAPEAPGGAPGEVVYDPTGRAPAAALDDVAQALLALKGQAFEDPALAGVSKYLADENTRAFGLDVPPAISPYPLKIATTYFDRGYLPARVLAHRTFPVVLSPVQPGIVLFLPAVLWPAVLLQGWRS
ncbi:MAG TPA: hypothetical protein VFM98_12775 [Ramlibacter sp.]|uniref:hypothetical protein n=1 Tax=Ramlibacter sp. TaxID=1917967 RepID=UPI002D7E963E|nr:hypothetical protein [Ramlibacter sp.]HET8746474.1 hypothetical protein [Ramlibacter sp.]